MPPDTRRLKAEIVHCLFLDIVGYSRASIQQQRRMARQLQDAVRAAPEFQRAQADSELILRDMGDGMALIFQNDPVAPAQCAVEIARAVQTPESPLHVRMGIHTGPVTHDTDITDAASVYGGGINFAQRVMACGDAGHILLSQRSAEDLRQFEEWAPYLRELGEVEVKHGERLVLFLLCVDDAGRPDVPEQFAPKTAPPKASPARAAAPLPLAAVVPEHGKRVVLLYKRNAQPDEHVLMLLEAHLKNAGYSVFIDRHLTIGVEWATEIEREVRSADAVIPLLSDASLKSEMLEYELIAAHDAAQRHGKPRIFPVRVGAVAALPSVLAPILDPLHYTVWNDATDDERLAQELLDALTAPPKAQLPRAELEPVGGAVPLDSKFYIVRPADALFTEAITRRDSVVLVKGARQMGKTSLLARGLHRAREMGARVVYTDLQTLNVKQLATADVFLTTVATLIARSLGIGVSPREIWDPDLGANMNMDWFMETHVLNAIQEPVVWGLDEVDRLFTCEFGGEVFGLVRSWHNRRALDPGGPWARLTLAIAYATEAHLFITDLNQSPFNVGTRLTIDDFTQEQVSELNLRYGGPLHGPGELSRFYALVSGHPYLVRRGLDEMVTKSLSIADLESQADRDEGLYGDHLRRFLVSLTKDEHLTDVIRGLLRGDACPTQESFYRLRSAGLLVGDSVREARVRCPFYASYLARHLG